MSEVTPAGVIPGPRVALVCFDFEGTWGMPSPWPYDIATATERILSTLAGHAASAVFFAVGKLVDEHPGLLLRISEAGHEVGLHGWEHEHIDQLTPAGLARFARGLEESIESITALTGVRPIGFRAPYLMGPAFYRSDVYRLLATLGFRWVSNREIRHPVELLRPDRIGTNRLWRAAERRPKLVSGRTGRLLRVLLNVMLCLRDGAGGTPVEAARWLWSGSAPFTRDGLLEVPLFGPLDCDLLGFPAPTEATPARLLAYARAANRLTITAMPMPMVTFHDWIVTGGNRLQLLDDALDALASAGLTATTVRRHFSL